MEKMNIGGTISHIEKRLGAHDEAFDSLGRDVKNLQALVYEHIDHEARHLKEPLEANTPQERFTAKQVLENILEYAKNVEDPELVVEFVKEKYDYLYRPHTSDTSFRSPQEIEEPAYTEEGYQNYYLHQDLEVINNNLLVLIDLLGKEQDNGK